MIRRDPGMNGLWIILLDKSGSMAEPFHGSYDAESDVEYSSHTSKIDEAKDRLVRGVRGLVGVEIIVVQFDSTAKDVVRANSGEIERIEAAVAQISADGEGTNIASALDLAYRNALQFDTRKRTILLISDGLSNQGDPVASARRCQEADLQINTILID